MVRLLGDKMSAWPEKYIIGLTGNIATGKSVVRRMLEHLGAYGIDADALGHRAIAKGAPAYQPVLDTFGEWILSPDGEIDRAKLARIVFADPDALLRLEALVHPSVSQAVDLLVRRSRQKVIVVEAIKLIESSLRTNCDSLWVACASQEVQRTRLIQKRGMNEREARQRIVVQSSQEEKVAAADVVIYNDGTFEHTWQQVVAAWQEIISTIGAIPEHPTKVDTSGMTVLRAGPRQADEIAAFITRLSRGAEEVSREDVMAAFGEKAFLMLKIDDKLVGLAGWQVENLVARTDDFYLEVDIPFIDAVHVLTKEVERASRDLQCEIALMFLPPELASKDEVWHNLGYQKRSINSLRVPAWQEAATESQTSGSTMLFKQLRKDRVIHPF